MMVNDEEKLKQIVELLNFVAKTEKADNETKLKNILTLLNDNALKTYTDNKNTIINTYDLNKTDKFNIFETISDTYYVENFHTDILFSILDPNTPEIGSICNDKILEKFVKMVDTSFKFTVDDTVKVSNQEFNIVFDGEKDKKGYTDLLITNNHNQAIIIENKINDAPDTKNQLVRYMKYVWEEKFGKDISSDSEDFKNNVRVVYLTLIPNGKKPDIERYSEGFAAYKEMLADGNTLKYRSAVDSDNTKDDLVKFLQKCIDILKDDLNIFNKAPNPCIEEKDKYSLKKIYLEQYQILLKHLGGKAKMSELGDKVIEKIYSDPTLLQAAKDLYEILEPNKGTSPKVIDKYINSILFPLLKNNMGFRDYKETTNKTYPVVWARTKNHFLYACAEKWNLEIGFGHHKQEFNKNDISKYKQILSQNIPSEELMYGEPLEDNNDWVYVRIEPTTKNSPMKEFLESYKGKIEKIKNAFSNTECSHNFL